MTRTRLITLALCAALTACSSNGSGPTRFLIPIVEANGENNIREVEISTLYSPETLEGAAASIVLRGYTSDAKLEGRTQLRLMKRGSTWVPLDTTAAQGLALYATFEQIYFREQKWGVASKLSWPRRIGVDFRVSPLVAERGEYMNNSYFFASMNSVAHYHSDDAEHVSTSLDPTVISHEHFHEYFEQEFVRVWKGILQKAFPTMNLKDDALDREFVGADSLSGLGYAFGLMLSWNEGLADYWSYAHTRQTHFGQWSIPRNTGFRQLDMSVTPTLWSPATSFATLNARPHGVSRRSEKYYVGSNLSRWIFKIGQTMEGRLPVLMLNRLPQIATAYAQEFLTREPVRTMSAVGNGFFLAQLFAQESAIAQPTCDVLQAALASSGEAALFQTVKGCRSGR